MKPFDTPAATKTERSPNVRWQGTRVTRERRWSTLGHAGATEAYQSYLDADLREQWGKAIADGVAKRWPGAKTPYKF